MSWRWLEASWCPNPPLDRRPRYGPWCHRHQLTSRRHCREKGSRSRLCYSLCSPKEDEGSRGGLSATRFSLRPPGRREPRVSCDAKKTRYEVLTMYVWFYFFARDYTIPNTFGGKACEKFTLYLKSNHQNFLSFSASSLKVSSCSSSYVSSKNLGDEDKVILIAFCIFLYYVLSNGSLNLHWRMLSHNRCTCLSPVCVFMCLLKWPTWTNAEAHWLHLFDFFHCVFSNVSSKRLHERMHSHIGYICLAFLHCAFSNVSSNCLHQKRHSRIGCICLTFLHCSFSNVASNGLHKKKHSHIDCICLTFLHCIF